MFAQVIGQAQVQEMMTGLILFFDICKLFSDGFHATLYQTILNNRSRNPLLLSFNLETEVHRRWRSDVSLAR